MRISVGASHIPAGSDQIQPVTPRGRYFVDHFLIVFSTRFWNHFGALWGAIWDPFWKHFCINVRLIFGLRLWTVVLSVLGSFWEPFGIIVGGHFGYMFALGKKGPTLRKCCK